MKYVSFFILVFTSATIFPNLAFAQKEKSDAVFSVVVAKSGCCKVRKSLRHPWANKGSDFAKCKAANISRDGDDIYSRKGLIMWDQSC